MITMRFTEAGRQQAIAARWDKEKPRQPRPAWLDCDYKEFLRWLEQRQPGSLTRNGAAGELVEPLRHIPPWVLRGEQNALALGLEPERACAQDCADDFVPNRTERL